MATPLETLEQIRNTLLANIAAAEASDMGRSPEIGGGGSTLNQQALDRMHARLKSINEQIDAERARASGPYEIASQGVVCDY